MSLRHAIITGATGAVGTALISFLVKNNIEITVLLNPDSSRNRNILENKNVHKIYCSMNEYKSIKLRKSNYDVFFHMAWSGTTGINRNDKKMQFMNLQNTLDAVKLAKESGCKKFVGVGSQAEYGRKNCRLSSELDCYPENQYGKYKLEARQQCKELCKELNIEFNWVRFLSVFGPYESPNSLVSYTIKSILNNEPAKYTLSEQVWDFLFSQDAAEALYLIAQKGVKGKTYVVGSGQERPLKEYIELIYKGIGEKKAPVFGDIPYSENQVMYLGADISELTEDTGFYPKTDFCSGVREMIEIEGVSNEKN